MKDNYVKGYLAIDQGTTSSRAIIFDTSGTLLEVEQKELPQIFPKSAWVEHDPNVIWKITIDVVKKVLERASIKGIQLESIGITNQRETTVLWERLSGKVIYHAIVWQDRRTSQICENLRNCGVEDFITTTTGLVLDPYFSATKIAWILDNIPGARQRAEKGQIAFGTIDSFLLWKLTDGRVHATDATNASRTSLFNIKTGKWDPRLLEIFNVPCQVLPVVEDSSHLFGVTAKSVLGKEIPITAILGDQQSAAVGQACFEPGSLKATFGTGGFLLINTGTKALKSKSRLLTTILFQINKKIFYAMEGSIFITGAAIQWLRDEMKTLNSAQESESLARQLESNEGVYLVPAFTGFGAPHWQPEARGAIFGITRNTGPRHLARAALESVAYQTNDIIQIMSAEGTLPTVLRADGGMVDNSWLMGFLADIANITVDVPKVKETTALGVAMIAAYAHGAFSTIEDISHSRAIATQFNPSMEESKRKLLIEGWDKAVCGTLSNIKS